MKISQISGALGLLCVLLIASSSASAQSFTPPIGNITVKDYLREAGGVAKYVPHGKLRLGGRRVQCGRNPSILDPEFDTWAGAFTDPGFIIVNPIYMKKEPAVVQLYIYAHECGHQFRGVDEDTADAFAIRRGVRYGWLKDKGMKQICRFISNVPGDRFHKPGPDRCRLMKKVYVDIVKRHKTYVAAKKARRRRGSLSVGKKR